MMSSSSATKAPAVDGMKDPLGNLIAPTNLDKSSDLGPVEVEKLVKDIKDDEVERIVGMVERVTGDQITPLEFSIFDYMGFDPRVILKVLSVAQRHYQDTDDTLISDIKFSIAACIYMGNLQEKALTRRAMEGKTKIEYLVRKYNIRIGSQGTGISATTLTFPRITASVPALAIRMAMRLPPKTSEHDFKSSLVPPGMRLTPFASLCSVHMPEQLRQFLLQVCNAHGSDMAIAYEIGRLKKAKKTVSYDARSIALDQWAFMEVASNSVIPSEGSRKALLTTMNLSEHLDNMRLVAQAYQAILEKREVSLSDVVSRGKLESELSEYLTG